MQTSYPMYKDRAFAGMLATSEFSQVTTRVAEGDIEFGLGMVNGSTDLGVKVPSATTDVFAGIARHTHNIAGKYKTKDAVNNATHGVYYVPVTVDVVAHTPAYVISTGANAGKFTNVSTNNIATGAKFRESGTAGSLVQVALKA